MPGLLTAVFAVGVAFTVHAMVPVLPAMTVAVVLGLLAANLPGTGAWVAEGARAGLDFAGKHLMRAGIVVLGLKVSVMDVLGLGWQALLLITGVVLASFAGTYGISRLFRLTRDASLLIATGFSICGASAIGAMAAVRRIRHVDTVLPVALVTLCGTLAIGVLPLLLHPLQLTPEAFGAWTGASVHDVGQVVATAQTAGAGALAIAVVVKLTRVILLAPIVAAAGVHQRTVISRDAHRTRRMRATKQRATKHRRTEPSKTAPAIRTRTARSSGCRRLSRCSSSVLWPWWVCAPPAGFPPAGWRRRQAFRTCCWGQRSSASARRSGCRPCSIPGRGHCWPPSPRGS